MMGKIEGKKATQKRVSTLYIGIDLHFSLLQTCQYQCDVI